MPAKAGGVPGGMPLLYAGIVVGGLLRGGPAAADCPPQVPPALVAEQAVLPDGALVRAVAGPGLAPFLVILDPACHEVARLGTLGGGDADPAGQSLLRFRVLDEAGLPQPLVVAVVASPGASDTSFSTQLIGARHGRYRGLLPRPVTSLLEGGLYVGDLGAGLGAGLAVWNFVWARSEAHVSPHRYTLQRYRWTGSGFTALATRTTRGKYSRPEAALAELRVAYPDLTAQFPDFAQFR
jgi:hypothetical protein